MRRYIKKEKGGDSLSLFGGEVSRQLWVGGGVAAEKKKKKKNINDSLGEQRTLQGSGKESLLQKTRGRVTTISRS